MGSITPRWEWRTFANDVGDVDRRLRTLTGGRRDSAETYIVAPGAEINTKIRDEILDIKVLQQVDGHGLELWLPVLKVPFPLTDEAVQAALCAWGLPPVEHVSRRWPVAAFLADIVARQPSLARVDVTKVRYGAVIDDCLVEIADLTFAGEPVRTIAVESVDADRVWRTVDALGLSTFENVSYVKALKRFIAVHTR